MANSAFVSYSFQITIKPILTNLNFINQLTNNQEVTETQVSAGDYLNLNNSRIDNIQFTVDGKGQSTVLSYNGVPYNTSETVSIIKMATSNYIFNGTGSAQVTFTINNVTGYYGLDISLIDLFRANDFMSIELIDPITGSLQPLFTGVITSPIATTYNSNGIIVVVNIESYLSVLNRISLVQIQPDQYIKTSTGSTQPIIPIATQQLNFGDYLTKIFNETLIPLNNPTIYYEKGTTDTQTEAVGITPNTNTKSNKPQLNTNQGTAIGSNTTLYVPTTPTASKLSCINQTIYPYHKVFWCDNNGDFHITTLQTYFDDYNDWTFTINAEYDSQLTNSNNIPISASSIDIHTNTSTIYNREVMTLLGITTLFNQTSPGSAGTNDGKTDSNSVQNIIAIATMQDSKYFPRLVDLYNSTKSFITNFTTQELNNNIITNPGLFNMASKKLGGLPGLKSIYTVNDNSIQVNAVKATDPSSSMKPYLLLYSARSLAENLFNDKLVSINFDMNLAYNDGVGFKIIPLGQMVNLPSVTTNVFDQLSQMYCYGYELSFDLDSGCVVTLHLCKPFTYTALWCDQNSIFDETKLGV